MKDPDTIASHPGPQGFESQASPINEKRGFPWKKIVFGSIILIVIYMGWSALTPNAQQDATSNATAQTPTSKPTRVPFFGSGSAQDDGPSAPRLVSILGTEATFEYDGAYFRLVDGVGPIGGDWFCGMLNGRGVATIYDGAGNEYKVGVDRTNTPDLWRNSSGSSGSVSGDVGTLR